MKKEILLFVFILSITNLQIHAQHKEISKAGNVNRFTKILPPAIFSNKKLLLKTTQTNITVSFEDHFPEIAKADINYAMGIWKEIINTPQEIKVKAIWSDSLGNKILAGTNPTAYIKGFPNSIDKNKFYPIALAESISGRSLNQNSSNSNYLLQDKKYWDYDIVIKFNSNIAWYYGTDGNSPAEKYDLVTVAMHEFTHGIGFASSCNYDKNTTIGSWGVGENNYSLKYDENLKTGDGSFLIQNFTNNSGYLGSALTSNNIYFAGQNAEHMEPNGYPKIYAPIIWESGSSISHLDENTYQAGNSNSLMTPITDKAEAIHSPGEITFGLLKDLGWSVSRIITVNEPVANTTWRKNNTYHIKWSDTENSYIGISLVDMQGKYISTISSPVYSNLGNENELIYKVPNNIGNGKYKIKFHEQGNYNGPGYGLSFTIMISDYPQVASPVFNPLSGYYQDTINVIITCSTPDAKIYYTTSGEKPDSNSLVYKSRIHIFQSMTLKAIAYKNEYKPSTVTEAAYTINNSVQNLVFFPKGGNYDFSNNYIYLSTNIKGGEIRYTLDGSEPTLNSLLYGSMGINLQFYNHDYNIKARVFKNNQPVSNVFSEHYHFYDNANDYVKCYFDQYDESKNPYKNYSIWSDELKDWMNFSQGVQMVELPNNTSYFFRTDTLFKPETKEKFYNVLITTKDTISYKNHSGFIIEKGISPYYHHNAYLKSTEKVTIISSYDGRIDLGKINIIDPWFRDDISDPKGRKNRGLNAIWHSYPSPFNITTSGSHQGVFLKQGYNDLSKPYYSVKVESPQTININGSNHKFYFQNWEAEPLGSADFQNSNSLITPVVFNNAGATVKAVMKGTQMTSNANTFAKNSQRKVYWKYPNGEIIMVYESMGKIWLEKSSNNGSTWTILNNGNPINTSGTASEPALAIDDSAYPWHYIVYIENIGTTKFVKVVSLDDQLNIQQQYTVASKLGATYNSPGIAITNGNTTPRKMIVLWKESTGFKFRTASVSNNISWINSSPVSITSSYSNSKNPTIESGSDAAHIAWEENNEIKYIKYNFNSSAFSGYTTVSDYNSMLHLDNSPSITVVNNKPQLCWLATSWGLLSQVAVLRGFSNKWGDITYYAAKDDEVTNVHINRTRDRNYLLAWSVGNGVENNYVKSSSLSSIKTTSQSGNYIQVLSEASNFGNSKIFSEKTDVTPYTFVSSPVTSGLAKTTKNTIAGRIGTVTNGENKYYFNISDVQVDGKRISFIEVSDSIAEQIKTSELIKSETFAIDKNTSLRLNFSSGIVSNKGNNTLKNTQKVEFNLQLVDAETNTVIGNIAKMDFDEDNIPSKKGVFNVDLRGVKNRNVYIKLSTTENIGGKFTLVNYYMKPTNELEKENIEEISLKGLHKENESALLGNYPNPFNPTTKIMYQLPKNDKVTIKVYDMLGKEIATVFSGVQSAGKHEVNFNASELASGVYIYKITTNNFTESKKMVLIK